MPDPTTNQTEPPRPDTANPFTWAYIGSGSISKSTAKQILKSGRHRIGTVHSRNPANTESFARTFHAQPLGSIEAAVTAPGIEAVYIGTPVPTHFDIARTCLELGRPVLLEKPFTVDADQARRLFEIARSNGVYLAEAMWTWFSPVSRQVRSWLEDGRIGRLEQIDISLGGPFMYILPRLRDPELAGGALMDLGIYPTTYAYNLLGMPSNVSCSGRVKNGVDIGERIIFDYGNDTKVNLDVSMQKLKSGAATLRGTEGMISVPFFHYASKARLRTGGSTEVFRGNGWYANEFDLVAGEIRAGRRASTFVPPLATVDNMTILDDCREQLGLRFPFER